MEKNGGKKVVYVLLTFYNENYETNVRVFSDKANAEKEWENKVANVSENYYDGQKGHVTKNEGFRALIHDTEEVYDTSDWVEVQLVTREVDDSTIIS